MDPLFGMVAVRDSRAMDAARQKNNGCEKDLKRRIARLEGECRSSTSKINSDTDELSQLLQDSLITDRQVVFPHGLSCSQKEKYKSLRRSSVQSMTLEQFDVRLDEVRKSREFERKMSESLPSGRNVGKQGRKQSGAVLFGNSPMVPSDPKIVQEAKIPVTRRRSSVMKDVFQRTISTLDKNETGVLKLPAISTPIVEFEKAWHKNGLVSSLLHDTCNPRANNNPSPTRRMRSGIQKSFTDSPQPYKRKTNRSRRATMATISDLEAFRQKHAIDSENGEGPLSRLDNIIESWRSSPAVKPTCATLNHIRRH